jgi:methyltransferase (TIGR00027 family)
VRRVSRPSFTARTVAVARGKIAAERRTVPTGNADAEARMYGELGGGRFEVTGSAWVAHMRPRTLFIDESVLAAIDRGVTQIVIVGAGYDGRALRFATPGVRFFEVDRAETQEDKRERVARAGGQGGEYVVFDVVDGGLPALLAPAGHDASLPSLFICEGLFPYLTRESIEELLDDLLALCAPEGSRVVLTTAEPSAEGPTLAGRLWGESVRRSVALIGEPWQSRFEHGETAQMLADRGWRIVREGADESRGYVSVKYEIEPA